MTSQLKLEKSVEMVYRYKKTLMLTFLLRAKIRGIPPSQVWSQKTCRIYNRNIRIHFRLLKA